MTSNKGNDTDFTLPLIQQMNQMLQSFDSIIFTNGFGKIKDVFFFRARNDLSHIGRFNATGVRSHYSDRFRQWGYDLPASIYEPII